MNQNPQVTTIRAKIRNLVAQAFASPSRPQDRADLLEFLEGRLALTVSPLPTLSSLSNPNDTVVRIETQQGDIDIELFNSDAPGTVSNFLTYVTSGRFDDTFFHRSAISPNPFVLQGGGFTYRNSSGLQAVTNDPPIALETTGHSNLARTVAMARTSAPNSATGQFFINYVDNTFLDPTGPGTGYAVFGKVIQGWSVVQAIEALSSIDLSGDPAFAGNDAGNFNTTPVEPSFNSTTGVRQADLVTIVNAEIIKPATTAGFFTQRIVYPEGFRSGSSVESMTMVNPNGTAASYQVIIHYETGARDAVIASGSIAANTSLAITLSDAAQASLNLVRSDTPYSVVVESALPESFTNPLPIGASSTRVDFGGAAGESFFNPASQTATNVERRWDFPRIERNSLSREFITWQNMSDTTVTVATTFRTALGDFTIVRTTEPYRRGGLDVSALGFADGILSATTFSDQDIVAALSDWDLPGPGATLANAYTPAFGVLGVTGAGAVSGGIGGAGIHNGFTDIISLQNTGDVSANVVLTFWRTGGTSTTKSLVVAAGGRSDLTLDSTDLGITIGETFSVTYVSNTPVVAQYTSFDNVGRNTAAGKHADGVATAFTASIAPAAIFGDGLLNPGNTAQTETVSIFNPFASFTLNYTVKFVFSDGTVITGATGTLAAHGRIDLVSGGIAAVRNKASSGTQFEHYSIVVTGTGNIAGAPGASTTPASGLVTLTRTDTATGRSIASSGMPSTPGLLLSDAIFGIFT